MGWFRKKKKVEAEKLPSPDLRIKYKDIDGGIDIIDISLRGLYTMPFIPCIGTIFKHQDIMWKIEEIFVDFDGYETGYHEVIVVKMSKI